MSKMRCRKSYLLIFTLLMLCWHFDPSIILAKESCKISVDTILAAKDDAHIDPQLKRHIGDLQSMFNYTSYRLLSSEHLNLKTGESGMVSLPGNRQLTITPNKIGGSRADISLKMIKQQRTVFQTQIQLLNRGSLFVGGPKYLNGNLIFKISSAY